MKLKLKYNFEDSEKWNRWSQILLDKLNDNNNYIVNNIEKLKIINN